MKQIVHVTGYCPETEKTASIDVTFAEIPILGQTVPSYKALSLRCEYASENGCSYDRSCPLIKTAENQLS